jgi:cutinase
MHSAVSGLSNSVKAKVIAGVLFGDTRNKQDGGQIRNYPKDQVMIFCAKDDGVCDGSLRVTAGHIVYLSNNDVDTAIQLLQSKINAATGRGSRRRSAVDEMV